MVYTIIRVVKGGPDHESRAYFRSNHESCTFFKHFTNHVFNIHRCKKNYPSLTNHFAMCLAFNTQSLKGVLSMEKEPQTHEMSPENALFPQNQSFKCPLRNANELSLLETF